MPPQILTPTPMTANPILSLSRTLQIRALVLVLFQNVFLSGLLVFFTR